MGFSGLGYCQPQGTGNLTWTPNRLMMSVISHCGKPRGKLPDKRLQRSASALLPPSLNAGFVPWMALSWTQDGYRAPAITPRSSHLQRKNRSIVSGMLPCKCQTNFPRAPLAPQQTFFHISLLGVGLCAQVLPNAERELTVIGMISQSPPMSLEMGLARDQDGGLGLYQEGRGRS